ncbi:transposase [Streptomyces microflavus]|uniref:transposase n=1 Tax=Streptomyces microflavus TaxID=1919 RepID=UPI00364C5C7C
MGRYSTCKRITAPRSPVGHPAGPSRPKGRSPDGPCPGPGSRDLLIAAHQQLDGPIVLIRDNLNVHKDRRMRAFIDAQDWITAYHLPPYAPDLNPVEGIRSVLRLTTQANTAFTDPDHLIRRLRHGLRQIHYRNDIIDGCLTGTGLTLTTPRLQPQ